jgi:predicted metal-binding protein
VVALEVCELIPVLEGDKVNAFCVILNKEMGNIIEYRTFIKHYKKNTPLREKAMEQETKSVNELNLKEIIYWKKKFQEMMIKSKKSALK